jgi:hypothetical protein
VVSDVDQTPTNVILLWTPRPGRITSPLLRQLRLPIDGDKVGRSEDALAAHRAVLAAQDENGCPPAAIEMDWLRIVSEGS